MTRMLRLRRFTPADADAVWELHNAALEGTGAHLGNGHWDDDLRQVEAAYLRPGADFLVGFEGDTLVAMGALRPFGDGVAEVKRMRVAPGFRRRGFARELLAALEARAVELGYSAIRLDTAAIQTAARALYESAGYVECGRGEVAGLETVFYEKRLTARARGAGGRRARRAPRR